MSTVQHTGLLSQPLALRASIGRLPGLPSEESPIRAELLSQYDDEDSAPTQGRNHKTPWQPIRTLLSTSARTMLNAFLGRSLRRGAV